MQTLFLWLEDCHVGLGKSLEQFTELGVETVDDFALVERNDLTKMGLHPSKIVAFFRKVKGIKPKARVDAANLALRVKTERKEYWYVRSIGTKLRTVCKLKISPERRVISPADRQLRVCMTCPAAIQASILIVMTRNSWTRSRLARPICPQ